MARRCGLAGSVVPRGKSDVLAMRTEVSNEVTRLLVSEQGGGGGESTAVSIMDTVASMTNGARALRAVLTHMEVWNDHAAAQTLRMETVSLAGTLQYDMSVARALSIFKSNKEATAVILNSSSSSALSGATDTYGDDADVDDALGDDSEWVPPTLSSPVSGTQAAFNLQSLLQATLTPMGGRTLLSLLQQPSREHTEISQRHDIVQALTLAPAFRSTLRSSRDCLKGFSDLEAIAARFRSAVKKVGLADLVKVYYCLLRLRALVTELGEVESAAAEEIKTSVRTRLLDPMRSQLDSAVKFQAMVEELVDPEALTAKRDDTKPRCFHKKKLQVKAKFTPDLMRLKVSLEEIERGMLAERDKVGKSMKLDVKNIHLEYSPTHGYHMRVTKTHAGKVTKMSDSKVLSAMKSGSLFVTTQMAALAKRYVSTKSQYQQAQESVVSQAVTVAATFEPVLRTAATLVGELDCHCAFAELAARFDWVRPSFHNRRADADTSADGENASPFIQFSRLLHPLLSARIGARCIPSDFILRADERIAIITGPNMGGKSTFVRSVASSVIMAQIGCFVPASTARLPLVDRIFVRMGASDSSTQGLSTFLTEMRSMNAILRDATPNSLVLIDELGRGTSTHDGFGIAWAVLERLKEIGCTVLFATHFHELTDMAQQTGVVNYHVSAMAPADSKEVTMLYEVQPGVCERSFGIHVARAVDFPPEIIREAEVLAEQMSAASAEMTSRGGVKRPLSSP